MGAEWTGHTFVAGRTGSGKSYWAAHRCLEWDGPCLVIDRRGGMYRDLGWPTADRKHRPEDLIAAAAGGICYVPHWDPTVARAETDELVAEIFARGPHSPAWLLCVDEAWRVAREGDRPGQVHRAAVEGRAAGIQLLAVSQRPADVSKDLVTQCGRIVIFQTSLEGPWMQRYGIDHAAVEALLNAAPPYSYVTWDGRSIQGPFREAQLPG